MLKAAILGAGGMGRRHADSLKKLGVPITAICDTDAKQAKDFKNVMDLSDAVVYQDFDIMLNKGDFTMLYICLPPFAHSGQFDKAALKDKHIFIEKPIALHSSVGVSMVRAAKQSGITTMVGFHMRKGAAMKRLAELIQSGKAGKPVLFNAQYECNSLHTSWWIKADLCGGQIFEQAIHINDLCRFFFGDPKFVEGVMGNVCHNHLLEYTIEDVSACIAGFTTGAIASITANNCAVPGKWIGKVTTIFEKLTANFADYNHGTITFTSDPEPKTEIIESDMDPYFEEDKEFAECVESAKPTSCPITEGFKSLCFVEAVTRSAKLDGIKLTPNTEYLI
jgi:predicted dehydrogenase